MAVSILSLIVLFVVSMLPTSIGSLRKAQAVQGATSYATEMLETARQSPPGTPIDTTVTVNNTTMHVVQQVLPIQNGLVDVKVAITYEPDVAPVILTTRLMVSPSPSP
jgi:type II secretory pathway pseudopilin PulG